MMATGRPQGDHREATGRPQGDHRETMGAHGREVLHSLLPLIPARIPVGQAHLGNEQTKGTANLA